MATAIIEKVTLFCDDCDSMFSVEAAEYIGNPDEVYATFVTDLGYDTRCPSCRKHIAFRLPSRTDDMRKTDQWSKKTMAQQKAQQWIEKNALILDTETTGLDSTAEIVEISLIDCTGAALLDTLIKPAHPIPADATRIHGITNEMVANAPTWPEVIGQFREIVQGRTLVIYNADYDVRIINQTNSKHSWPTMPIDAECAMLACAEFYGEWDDYRNKYKWQRLGNAARQQGVVIEGEAHRALADCRMTLGIIKAMAAGGKK